MSLACALFPGAGLIEAEVFQRFKTLDDRDKSRKQRPSRPAAPPTSSARRYSRRRHGAVAGGGGGPIAAPLGRAPPAPGAAPYDHRT
jgi:hypothetical protein